MTHQADLLAQLSHALAARTAAVEGAIVAIRVSAERHVSGTVWQPDVVVASEQSLPNRKNFELVVAGGSVVAARVIGRDPGTNVALLRVIQPLSPPSLHPGETRVGALALAFGANGEGGPTARMGVVNVAGPEWVSLAGGHIHERIVLDMRLARSEEGGPVLDTAGAMLGISTFGPSAQILVIPTATVDRIVSALLENGHIGRGWLGVALQPVAVPDALRDQAGQSSGLMVMSIAEGGPAAKAGILPGDIVLTVNGAPAHRLRNVATQLASDSIGRQAEIHVIRSGTVHSLRATIEARPNT